MRRLAGVALCVVLGTVGGVAVGCGGDDGPPEVRAADAVVGASVTDEAAAYLTLRNGGGADRVVGITSPAAEAVSLHDTVDEGGASSMRRIDGIDVPAGGEVVMSPGGVHLMLERLARPLAAGDTVELRVELDRSGPIDVTAQVVPLADLADRVGR